MKLFKKIDWKNIDWKKVLKDYGLIVLGTFIMSIGYVIFVSPLKLAPGGVYGIAIILHHVFNFPIGLSGICLDLPLLLIGTLWLGPKFGAKTVVGVITLPTFISMWEGIYGYAPLISLPGQPMIPDPSANFIIALCASALSVGFHKITLLCFVETSMRVESHLFYKVAEEAVSTAITFHYRIDNGAFQTILNSANSSFISLDLDMSELTAGVHTIDHFITNAQN